MKKFLINQKADAEDLANAKLISAAPELLEALQESTRWLIRFKEMVTGSEYEKIIQLGINKNQEAIKKAT